MLKILSTFLVLTIIAIQQVSSNYLTNYAELLRDFEGHYHQLDHCLSMGFGVNCTQCYTTDWTRCSYCQRKGVFYNIGGKLCYSEPTGNECPVGNITFGVNGNGENFYDPYTKITYFKDDRNVYVDPYYTWSSWADEQTISYYCRGRMKGVPPGQAELYKASTDAAFVNYGLNKCISYPVDIPTSGIYEFRVKTFEFYKHGAGRGFSIRLDNLNILDELNIQCFVGKCTAMDIITEIEVNIHQNGGKFTAQGFTPQPLRSDRKLYLNFCFGKHGNNDTNAYFPCFQFAAFHFAIIKHLKTECIGCKKTTMQLGKKPVVSEAQCRIKVFYEILDKQKIELGTCKDWFSSQMECENFKSDLVQLDNQLDKNMLIPPLCVDKIFWIGAHDNRDKKMLFWDQYRDEFAPELFGNDHYWDAFAFEDFRKPLACGYLNYSRVTYQWEVRIGKCSDQYGILCQYVGQPFISQQ